MADRFNQRGDRWEGPYYDEEREEDRGPFDRYSHPGQGPFNRYSQYDRGAFNRYTEYNEGPFNRPARHENLENQNVPNRPFRPGSRVYRGRRMGGPNPGRYEGFQPERSQVYEFKTDGEERRTNLEDFGRRDYPDRMSVHRRVNRGYTRTYLNRGWDYDYEPELQREADLEGLDQGMDYAGRYRKGFEYDWQGENYAPQYRYREYWNVPGPYTGFGPNYRRSDERIYEDIAMRLSLHGHLDASDIEVDVNSSEVTLTGSVDSRWSKRLAEDLALSVPGVEDVHNRLRVRRAGESQEEDRDREEKAAIQQSKPLLAEEAPEVPGE